MAHFRGQRSAFGFPGAEPSWTEGDKDGVGTAYSSGSRVWFTIRRGILTEIYYPTVDRPQVRDLEFLFADGGDLFLEEKHDFDTEVERLCPTQGYRTMGHDRDRRFSLSKEIIVDPGLSCVLVKAKLDAGNASLPGDLRVYLLCAPHLEEQGSGNNAFVVEVSGRNLLVAERNNHWLAIGSSTGFSRLSCGYVGTSDGYTDIALHHRMEFEFDEARNGNVALTGELNLRGSAEFTISVAFGQTLAHAVSTLFQSLGTAWCDRRRIFFDQWRRVPDPGESLGKTSGDNGRLFGASYTLLLTHEDKEYQGAFVASLSIPWGAARNDQSGKGGYHLVWTRDLVETALGLLAAGNTEAPLRALIYLAARQEEDGGFPQNFRVNGEPYRTSVQLDEVAFPVILARHLDRFRLLQEFDPRVMVRRAVAFLLHKGPVTGEERWEEASGYSPSTLAVIISALICGAYFFRSTNEEAPARFLESYADFLRAHLEEWTVTSRGSLVPGGPERYFVRLNPAKPGETCAPGDVDRAEFSLSSQPPGSPKSWPARDIVDPGFLLLVRYGVMSANDPLIVDSLRVVDAVLKAELPQGPCWHRYNHDGYGQKPDGAPFDQWGQGRPWPLMTGERGHYELAAGRDSRPYVRALEQFANATGLIPEQVWNGTDIPAKGLWRGGPTGSANPLLWAHAEYLRLLRSSQDGEVFDLIPEVAARYQREPVRGSEIEYWLPAHPIRQARKGHTLRICAPGPFRLHWSRAGESLWRDSESTHSGIGAEYVDIAANDFDPFIDFTFFWKDRHTWEGRNYQVRPY